MALIPGQGRIRSSARTSGGSRTRRRIELQPVKLAIVIPTFNERDNIAELSDDILALRLPSAVTIKLIIVDDNSPDGTGALADALAAKYPGRVDALHRLQERGRASAGIAGFRRALADPEVSHVIEMDADFSHHPSDIPRLIDAEPLADVIIGSRYTKGGVAINCAALNRSLSIAINIVNYLLLGIRVRDSSGGFKLYRRKVLETIRLDEYVSTAYSVGVETLLKCKNRGFQLKEVPITFRNRERGKSKMDGEVIREYPRTIARLKWMDLQGKVG
jgi:dolichol-phosphate mannosyltransferase